MKSKLSHSMLQEDPNTPQANINLGTVPIFGESENSLPYHILQQLGRGSIHRVSVTPPEYNLNGLEDRLRKKVLRTESEFSAAGRLAFHSVLLRTGNGVFAICRKRSIRVYGANQKAASLIAIRLFEMARSLSIQRKPGYYLLERSYGSIGTEEVSLSGVKVPNDQELELLYGSEFPVWHEDFITRFKAKPSGLTILEGPPGTGKTTFLKALMARHAETHCFYYIAPHDIHCLVDSDFIAHWAREREKHTGKALALIIEDAEQALMARASDNRSLVQVILNYADGMLADFLRLQIIATVNCKASQLDEALLRPGRLMSRRHFGRLMRSDARRLAAHHGLTLPEGNEDYSLAEIFNEQPGASVSENKILGFAA